MFPTLEIFKSLNNINFVNHENLATATKPFSEKTASIIEGRNIGKLPFLLSKTYYVKLLHNTSFHASQLPIISFFIIPNNPPSGCVTGISKYRWLFSPSFPARTATKFTPTFWHGKLLHSTLIECSVNFILSWARLRITSYCWSYPILITTKR